jgi:hypothetical protein
MLKVQRVLSPESTLQSGTKAIFCVIHPSQKISTILHRSFIQIDLRTQPVVGNQDDPRAIKAVLNLVLVHHSGMTEHEGTAMNVDY